MKKRLAIVLFIATSFVFAQNKKLDSLWSVYHNKTLHDTARIKAFNAAIWSYKNNKPDTALILAKQLLEWAQKIKSAEYEVNALNLIGLAHMYGGDPVSASDAFTKALSKAEASANPKGAGDSYHNLGIVNQRRSNFPKALQYYLKALQIREEIGDRKGVAASCVGIGIVYANESDPKKALAYYLKGLKLYEAGGDKKGMDACYNNMGGVYFSQGNYAKALEFDLKALKIREEIGDIQGAANCYNNIADIYFVQGNYHKTQQYYLRALQLKKKLEDQEGIATCYGNLAELNNRLGNYKQALLYNDSCLSLSKQINDLDDERLSYERMADVYAKTNEYKEAYEYYVKFKVLTDSIFNEENTKQLSDLKTRFEVEQKETELNAKAAHQEELVNEQEKRQRFTIYAVSGMLLLVLVFSFFLYKRAVYVNKQKQTIEFLFKEVHHRVKNNLQVISSLLNLQKGYITDKKTLDVFQDCQNRIFAMSAIHEKIYGNSALSNVNFNAYIKNLIEQLVDTYQVKYKIKYDLEVKVGNLETDVIIPLGLLTNEIISNALKYAFVKDDGTNMLTFHIERKENDLYKLIIGDNGKGSDVKLDDEHDTFGLELIKILVAQLHGTIRQLPVQGTMYEVVFNLPK